MVRALLLLSVPWQAVLIASALWVFWMIWTTITPIHRITASTFHRITASTLKLFLGNLRMRMVFVVVLMRDLVV